MARSTRLRRRIGLACAVAGALASTATLAGCGGGGADPHADASAGAKVSNAAIATFDGAPVSRREYDARHRFEALQATAAATGAPVLRRSGPAAIRFDGSPRQCVADVRRLAAGTIAKAVARRGDADLRQFCRETARKVRFQTVNGLLAARVTDAEARALGVTVTKAQVAQQQRALYEQLGDSGDGHDPAAASGIDQAVLDEKARVTALERELYRRIVARDGQVTDADRRAFFERNRGKFDPSARFERLTSVLTQAIAPDKSERAVSRWQTRARDTWRPRIECRDGYAVTELCGNKALPSESP